MAGTRSTPKPKPSTVTVERPSDGSLELVTEVEGKRIVLVAIPANIMRHLLRDS